MDKPNVFSSSRFFMDSGDILHILIKDLTGTGVTIGLNGVSGGESNEEVDIVIGTTTISVNDLFLPSKDELNEMYIALHLFGVGGFANVEYWSSSESDATGATDQNFTDGSQSNTSKTPPPIFYVRACRAFTSTTVYALREIGPVGGWIFWKSGNNYLEAAPSDSGTSDWSNINTVAIGTTSTAIGTGQANTIAIINQVGHTDSAAKLCDDLSIVV